MRMQECDGPWSREYAVEDFLKENYNVKESMNQASPASPAICE